MTVAMTLPAINEAKRAMLIEKLSNVEGKAEIINGKVVRMSPGAAWHGYASKRIFRSLIRHEDHGGGGGAFGDNVGFIVYLPGRFSFSPDVAWKTGDLPKNKGAFFDGPPDFAVEVRSLKQFGPVAERKILKKIKEYFMAGTKVVWDVDQLRNGWIKKYTPETIDNPRVFKKGEIADAEPAVPGWSMAVKILFQAGKALIP